MPRISTRLGFRPPNIFAAFITRQLRVFGTGFSKHSDSMSETSSARDTSMAFTIRMTQFTRKLNDMFLYVSCWRSVITKIPTSQLFYWLWPKILQLQLDIFVEYWNNHKIRYQKDKPNMLGQTPRHAFTVPPEAPYENCGIRVDQAVIDALRGQIPVSREDSMRWVDNSFEKAAQDAYNVIGRPILSMTVGWSVFSAMAQVIDQAGS